MPPGGRWAGQPRQDEPSPGGQSRGQSRGQPSPGGQPSPPRVGQGGSRGQSRAQSRGQPSTPVGRPPKQPLAAVLLHAQRPTQRLRRRAGLESCPIRDEFRPRLPEQFRQCEFRQCVRQAVRHDGLYQRPLRDPGCVICERLLAVCQLDCAVHRAPARELRGGCSTRRAPPVGRGGRARAGQPILCPEICPELKKCVCDTAQQP